MKSFTLTELMVSLLIFGLLAAGMYSMLATGMSVYMTDSATLDLQQTTRGAMDRFIREVRSSRFTVVRPLGENNDKISFNTPGVIGVQYYIDGTRLVREYPPGTLTPVADEIQRFKLALNGAMLSVTIQAGRSFYQRPLIFSLTEQVRLRNE